MATSNIGSHMGEGPKRISEDTIYQQTQYPALHWHHGQAKQMELPLWGRDIWVTKILYKVKQVDMKKY